VIRGDHNVAAGRSRRSIARRDHDIPRRVLRERSSAR
jgi:hypothetical protein